MKAVIVALFGILISNSALAVTVDCSAAVAKDAMEAFSSRGASVTSEPQIQEITRPAAIVLLKKWNEQVYQVYYSSDLEVPVSSDLVYKVIVTVQHRSPGPGGKIATEEQQVVTLRNKDCSGRFTVAVGSTAR